MIPLKTTVNETSFELSENLYLVEFDNNKLDKTELISLDDDGDKVASAKGVVIYRLIDTTCTEVAKQDAESLTTDLSVLVGKTNVVLACAHPPYNDISEYHWKLFLLSEISNSKDLIMIESSTVATDEQTTYLNNTFPGWLNLVAKFDCDNELTK